jgi:hypothetical protein
MMKQEIRLNKEESNIKEKKKEYVDLKRKK